jgi:hypothetical protein
MNERERASTTVCPNFEVLLAAREMSARQVRREKINENCKAVLLDYGVHSEK